MLLCKEYAVKISQMSLICVRITATDLAMIILSCVKLISVFQQLITYQKKKKETNMSYLCDLITIIALDIMCYSPAMAN